MSAIPVLQIDMKTEQIIQKFDSIKEAEKITGAKNISKVCRGVKNCKSAGGFKWKYADKKIELSSEEKIENLATDREKNFIDIHNKLLKKWNEDTKVKIGIVSKWNNAQKTFSDKQRKFELIDNVITCTEKCLSCKERKPITPLYFNIEKTFNVHCEPGKESISNTPSQGCRECTKNNCKKRAETREEYIRVLLKPYPKLDKNWYEQHPNKCAISNIDLIEKNNVDWRVSIQNNILKDLKSNIVVIQKGDDHYKEHCIKIACEFNIQEQSCIRRDLVTTYKEEIFPTFLCEIMNPSDTTQIMKYVEEWYEKTPKESGVNEQNQIEVNGEKKINPEYSKNCKRLHLKTILQDQLNNYKRADKNSKNIERHKNEKCDLSVEKLFKKLIYQKMKCYYTGIPLSTERDTWNYWSLERLDNNKNHTYENTVFICRIFNSAAGLNRKKLLYALSKQIHIHLSEEQRLKIDECINN